LQGIIDDIQEMHQDERELLMSKLAEANARCHAIEQELHTAKKRISEYEDEIRTPLNAIEGFARVMAETDSAEERMKYMEIVESNNSRVLALINEILDLSRVEAGEISIRKSMTDLNELCKNIQLIFKFRCSESVELIWSKPNMTVTLNTDVNRITQVISNLISNALKHTTQGNITYGYRLINDGQEVEFFVSDTGSGIAPEDVENIFQTYVSRDAETQNGYGLGLALCKIIVEKMGGTISVSSKLGAGSTFRFILPFEGTIGGMVKNSRITTEQGNNREYGHNNLCHQKHVGDVFVGS